MMKSVNAVFNDGPARFEGQSMRCLESVHTSVCDELHDEATLITCAWTANVVVCLLM